MKEFQDIAAWIGSFKSPEPPYPALSEWLELESRRATRRELNRIGVALACVVGAAVTLGGVAILAEASYDWTQGFRFLLLFPVGFAIAGAFPTLGVYALRSRYVQRKAQAIDPEVARAVTTLHGMRSHRRLCKRLGRDGAIELNEGAVLYFRCRMALMSDAWNSQAPNEPWGEARRAMLGAMEAAMGRLALCVVKKRSFTEIGPILEEMRAATNEAVRVTELRALTAGSAGQGLRASTHRMRELAKDEEDALSELRVTR